MAQLKFKWTAWPQVDRSTLQSVCASLLAKRWSISGPHSPFESYIFRAEKELARLMGRKFAVTTVNGSAAILIALQCLDIGPGDYVLLPATTWVGCATAVLRVGAIPVFADGGSLDPGMDPGALENIDKKKIKAIIAVHLYALQLDILALRRKFPHVKIIEDCSHCHGAVDANNRKIGTFGDLAIFSFQATKILTCGEGGAVLTDDAILQEKLMALRADSRGIKKSHHFLKNYELEPAGVVQGANYALSEIHAALLNDQIEKLPWQNRERAEGLETFTEALVQSNIKIIGTRASLEKGTFYGIMVHLGRNFFPGPPEIDSYIDRLYEISGLNFDPVYPPIPHSPLYLPKSSKRYSPVQILEQRLPNAEKWYREGIVIPHYAFLAPGDSLRGLAHLLVESVEKKGQIKDLSYPYYIPREVSLPEVTAIVLTHNRPQQLRSALGSIKNQDYGGAIKIIVVGDNCDQLALDMSEFQVPPKISLEVFNIFSGEKFQQQPAVERIARLRNMACTLVQSRYICFLDDDNEWEPNHLSSLYALMAETGALAVHSWRRLVRPDGRPFFPDKFPWLPPGEYEREIFLLYVENGVMGAEDSVVMDIVSLVINGVDHGMVDMGEWFFDKTILDILPFESSFDGRELDLRVGEDDKILSSIRQAGIPVSCTKLPTLRYTIGGISNRS